MRRLLHLIMLLLFVASGLFFGTLNQVPATVDFFFLTVEWPLALALASFFFAGALFGGLLTWAGSWLTTRQQIRELKRRQKAASPAPGNALLEMPETPPGARGSTEPG